MIQENTAAGTLEPHFNSSKPYGFLYVAVALWGCEERKKSAATCAQEFTSHCSGAFRRSIPIVYRGAADAWMDFAF